MESIIETETATLRGFIQGRCGSLWVAFEEGTSAAWLYALLKAGNKNDRVDARKLSGLLRPALRGRE